MSVSVCVCIQRSKEEVAAVERVLCNLPFFLDQEDGRLLTSACCPTITYRRCISACVSSLLIPPTLCPHKVTMCLDATILDAAVT